MACATAAADAGPGLLRLLCCPLQEFHRLQGENFQLKAICEDQEQALEELGSKLSEYVASFISLPLNRELDHFCLPSDPK